MNERLLALLFVLLSVKVIGQESKKEAAIDSLFSIVIDLRQSNPDSALLIASQLEGMLQLQESYGQMADLYRNISIAFFSKSEYHRSIEFGEKSLKLYRSQGDSIRVAFCYSTIGNSYRHLGDRKKCIEYYLSSLELRREYGNAVQYATGLQSIGDYYMEIEDYQKCEEYYLRALEMLEAINDPSRTSDMYFSMGILLAIKQEYDKSSMYYENALQMFEELGEVDKFPEVWNAIGYNFLQQGNYEKAKVYFLNADEGLSKTRHRNRYCYNLMQLSSVETKLGNYNAALQYADKASQLAYEISHLGYSKLVQQKYTDVFIARGDFRKAYESLALYNQLSDSLFSTEKENTIKELTIKYETELKEQEIERLSSEKELQEKEILLATNEKNVYMVAVVFAIALAISILAFFTQRQKAMQLRSEKAIAQRNIQIDALLQEQEISSLNSLLEGQEKERLRIAEELHDRLGSLLSAIKLNFNGWVGKKDLSLAEIKDYSAKTSGLLDEAVTEVRRVSHNLSTGQVSRYGLIGSMEDLADTINRSNSLTMKVLHFNLGERLPIELETGIYRIVQEMLANVLKHANAREFTVQLSRTDNSVILTAEDDGKGFDYKEARQHGGIGLQNIENRAKKFGGEFSVDSSPGKGTIFTFEFPLET